MFSDLFQLVFHPNDELLYSCVVGFGTGGVNFSAHFLKDEAQLLAGVGLGVYDLHKVLSVLAEAYHFFVDVILLQLQYHFLLHTRGL